MSMNPVLLHSPLTELHGDVMIYDLIIFARMGPEEVSRFTLDNTLGGISEVLQRKAIHR